MAKRCLIVEDEFIVAMGLQDCLEELGYQVTGIAKSAQEARWLARQNPPEVAFVDINLSDGPTGIEVARSLSARGVVSIFVTANRSLVPDDFAGAAGVMTKPYTDSDISHCLRFLTDCLSEKIAVCERPPCLEISPASRERWQVQD